MHTADHSSALQGRRGCFYALVLVAVALSVMGVLEMPYYALRALQWTAGGSRMPASGFLRYRVNNITDSTLDVTVSVLNPPIAEYPGWFERHRERAGWVSQLKKSIDANQSTLFEIPVDYDIRGTVAMIACFTEWGNEGGMWLYLFRWPEGTWRDEEGTWPVWDVIVRSEDVIVMSSIAPESGLNCERIRERMICLPEQSSTVRSGFVEGMERATR